MPVLRAQESTNEIKPPFNLSWGLSSESLERLLKGAKANIVRRRHVEKDRDAWEVEGLVAQSGVKRTVFYFKRGELVEVELQYQKDDWDEAKYNDYMGQLRRVIEKRYGTGQQIVRKHRTRGHRHRDARRLQMEPQRYGHRAFLLRGARSAQTCTGR